MPWWSRTTFGSKSIALTVTAAGNISSVTDLSGAVGAVYQTGGTVTVTNEPGPGSVLSLDGVSQYVLLPDPVANASTFAGWAKWSGGAGWQRLFDFGTGTANYLFLTPMAYNGKMRFGITTGGAGAEQIIEASTAMPTKLGAMIRLFHPIRDSSQVHVIASSHLERASYPCLHGAVECFGVIVSGWGRLL